MLFEVKWVLMIRPQLFDHTIVNTSLSYKTTFWRLLFFVSFIPFYDETCDKTVLRLNNNCIVAVFVLLTFCVHNQTVDSFGEMNLLLYSMKYQ